MIESCPKKRMLIGISFLGLLTIVVLIVESHWTDLAYNKKTFPVEQNSTCWKEPSKVVRECEPCTDFEIASQSFSVCKHTHFKVVLECASGETVIKSCDRTAYYDEQAFWRFEGFMLFASVISIVCVRTRKNVLNKRMLQRVQRQLANCV